MVKTGMQLKSNQKRATGGRVVKRRAQQQRALKAAMIPETQAHDTIQELTQSGQMASLNIVTFGGENKERLGNQIRVSSLSVRFTLLRDPSVAASYPRHIRLIIFQDTAVNGVTPLMEDVLTANTNSMVFAYRNMNQIPRFKIFKDTVLTFNNGSYFDGTNQAVQGSAQYFSYSTKGLNIPILFNDSVLGVPPTVANLKTNGLWVMATDGTGDGTSFGVGLTLTLSARIRYFD